MSCRDANLPAFGGKLPLFTHFPAIPRGIHGIPLFQKPAVRLRNISPPIHIAVAQYAIYSLSVNSKRAAQPICYCKRIEATAAARMGV